MGLLHANEYCAGRDGKYGANRRCTISLVSLDLSAYYQYKLSTDIFRVSEFAPDKYQKFLSYIAGHATPTSISVHDG